ncbi:SirB2 family protein [Paraferrimonas haliotis]|uniref:SirB family protein n=1 Tax=Paraferrimonas haliotis TaxID=2013866 RepID=A0AA37WYE2_9GAMM|nr:SirB2 family protein [Paraferrimonas haliotis]GLS82971.1 SirB family protein [Paraferrimonas haliotis]
MHQLAVYYTELKHFHTMLVAISVLFFITRFYWHMTKSPIMGQKWVKISPHVIDTFLLLSGLVIALAIGFTPSNSPWLTEKLIAVVAYIVLAVIAIKADRKPWFKITAAVGAIAWVLYAAKVAMTKQAMMLG